jgi:uncharacterized protein (TIGR01244 family)
MKMDAKKINDTISVAPQLTAAEMEQAAALGFKTVVNNRPDGEGGPEQPASKDVGAAAAAAGLHYVYMPVVSGSLTEDNITEFRKALADVPKPVLAYCRTGTRCTNLWALAVAADMPVNDIVRQAADAGYDLRALAPVLEKRAGK